jgi:hypothetical protein
MVAIVHSRKQVRQEKNTGFDGLTHENIPVEYSFKTSFDL